MTDYHSNESLVHHQQNDFRSTASMNGPSSSPRLDHFGTTTTTTATAAQSSYPSSSPSASASLSPASQLSSSPSHTVLGTVVGGIPSTTSTVIGGVHVPGPNEIAFNGALPRVYIGNVPPNVTDQELLNLFRGTAKCSRIHIKDMSVPAFAFLHFEGWEGIEAAVARNNGTQLQGYTLRIEFARSATMTCYNCHREGHISKSCPHPRAPGSYDRRGPSRGRYDARDRYYDDYRGGGVPGMDYRSMDPRDRYYDDRRGPRGYDAYDDRMRRGYPDDMYRSASRDPRDYGSRGPAQAGIYPGRGPYEDPRDDYRTSRHRSDRSLSPRRDANGAAIAAYGAAGANGSLSNGNMQTNMALTNGANYTNGAAINEPRRGDEYRRSRSPVGSSYRGGAGAGAIVGGGPSYGSTAASYFSSQPMGGSASGLAAIAGLAQLQQQQSRSNLLNMGNGTMNGMGGMGGMGTNGMSMGFSGMNLNGSSSSGMGMGMTNGATAGSSNYAEYEQRLFAAQQQQQQRY